MYKNDKVVRVRPFDSATVQFKSYLSQSISIARNTTNKKVRTILIGHNAFTLDTRILLRKAGNEVSSKLQSMDVWFTDSLSLYSKNHSQKFRTMSGVTYVATFNAVIGSRLFRKQVTLVPLPTSKL